MGPERTVEHKLLQGAITQRYPGLVLVLLNFLAPSGAQGVAMSVCLSVRQSVRHSHSLSRALNLHLSGSGLSHSSLSQVSLCSILGHSQVLHRSLIAYFVGMTEPKILRLVFKHCDDQMGRGGVY